MNDFKSYYDSLKKPPLAPPNYLFGIVWPVLYILIAISYIFVFWKAFRGEVPKTIIIPFIINLIANFLYTYLQFRLKNFTFSVIDILIVLITIITTMIVIWPYYRWVSYLQIPYLLWVSFATYLQIGVTVLNR